MSDFELVSSLEPYKVVVLKKIGAKIIDPVTDEAATVTDGKLNVRADIVETLPTDSTHLNPSLTVTESVLGTVTTKTITKTIGAVSYVKTVESDSSDNSVSVSAWSVV